MALSSARFSLNLCRICLKSPPGAGLRGLTGVASGGSRVVAVSGVTPRPVEQQKVCYQPVVSHQSVCRPSLPLILPVRTTSFFNKLPADHLWKGVTSVSNAGRKKGRGNRVMRKRNLNRGQIIGVGKENMVWPGLNTPILRGRELIRQAKLPKDEEREKKLFQMRDSMPSGRPRMKVDPLDRGWSGSSIQGRSVGPPDSIGEDNFEGFDTKILEFKLVVNMTKIFGRTRRYSLFAVTGNGNGVVGFALSKATAVPDGIRKVKNKAGQRLVYIELSNGHTVLHDFYTQFGQTKIFVKKVPEGYGLKCHRAIKTICEVAGIKDIYAKVEGSTNVQNVTKAFILGLIQQKSYQQLADDKGLHLVELRNENLNFPKVIASPQSGIVRTKDEIPNTEELNFTRYVMEGKVPLQRKKYPPPYQKLPSYEIYLKKFAKRRNQEKVKVDLRVQYGECRSFLTDEYPECRPGNPQHYLSKDNEA